MNCRVDIVTQLCSRHIFRWAKETRNMKSSEPSEACTLRALLCFVVVLYPPVWPKYFTGTSPARFTRVNETSLKNMAIQTTGIHIMSCKRFPPTNDRWIPLTKCKQFRALILPLFLACTSCLTNSRFTGNLGRRSAHVRSLWDLIMEQQNGA